VQQHDRRTVACVSDGDSQIANLDPVHAVSTIVAHASDMIGNGDDDKRRSGEKSAV
jgi:hypothetical protein